MAAREKDDEAMEVGLSGTVNYDGGPSGSAAAAAAAGEATANSTTATTATAGPSCLLTTMASGYSPEAEPVVVFPSTTTRLEPTGMPPRVKRFALFVAEVGGLQKLFQKSTPRPLPNGPPYAYDVLTDDEWYDFWYQLQAILQNGLMRDETIHSLCCHMLLPLTIAVVNVVHSFSRLVDMFYLYIPLGLLLWLSSIRINRQRRRCGLRLKEACAELEGKLDLRNDSRPGGPWHLECDYEQWASCQGGVGAATGMQSREGLLVQGFRLSMIPIPIQPSSMDVSSGDEAETGEAVESAKSATSLTASAAATAAAAAVALAPHDGYMRIPLTTANNGNDASCGNFWKRIWTPTILYSQPPPPNPSLFPAVASDLVINHADGATTTSERAAIVTSPLSPFAMAWCRFWSEWHVASLRLLYAQRARLVLFTTSVVALVAFLVTLGYQWNENETAYTAFTARAPWCLFLVVIVSWPLLLLCLCVEVARHRQRLAVLQQHNRSSGDDDNLAQHGIFIEYRIIGTLLDESAAAAIGHGICASLFGRLEFVHYLYVMPLLSSRQPRP